MLVNGILFDLGVSSPQLDDSDRGFSFMREGKLDMRMNTAVGIDAATWLATVDEQELANVLWTFGEERFSRRIARRIVEARMEAPLTTTKELAEIVSLSSIHQLKVYTCTKHLAEIQQTLSKPKVKKYLSAAPRVFVETFRLSAELVEIDESFDRSPDPDDNYLFDLAYTVKSHYIVTREKALLNLKQVNKIKIISMAELRKTIQKHTT